MKIPAGEQPADPNELETREWLDSLDYVIQRGGQERVQGLLERLRTHARQAGIEIPFSANTPYINTIPVDRQPVYPGSREIERRIKSVVRWNALAMVVRANREETGIGGHISTYASAATLYEVGFNHFFRAKAASQQGDIVYFQGHASPGIYSRAFLEGRVNQEHLQNFRRELRAGGGLSSYPHPWLMPDFGLLLPGVDRDLVTILAKRLDHVFSPVRLNTKVVELKEEKKGIRVRFEGTDVESADEAFERVLVAVGPFL